MPALTEKNILLIVTGGIAAYKALELVRRLRDVGNSPRVIMTNAAQQFVGPLSFQALSGNPVHTNLLDPEAEAGMGHIELARWAELIVVAPASANFIARLAIGFADDLASTVCLASSAEIIVAPAMNQQMWLNEATQRNIKLLTERHIKIVGPGSGYQACGEVGPGRLVDLDEIFAALINPTGAAILAGRRVMITAGPTQEAIDPVRYVSNRSSGKMGYALAEAALTAGAEVTLVSGPTNLSAPPGVTLASVVSADDMYQTVVSNLPGQDIFIAAAAVADYTFATPLAKKKKKSSADLTLTLTPTQDILKAVSALSKRPFCVGFAAETDDVVANARDKLQRKSLDMIAANDVSDKTIGFDSDHNELLVLWPGGEAHLPNASKRQIAAQLINIIAERHAKVTKVSD